MKETLILICLLTSISIRANEPATWIIENETAGSNILYRPNDYVFEEPNPFNLVITGNIGEKVVSPVDGIITAISYGYMFNLQRTMSLKSPSSKLVNDSLFRKSLAVDYNKNNSKYIDAKYIRCLISISTKKHGKVHLQGIINPTHFITGQKIKKGEVIGEIGYCYHKIEQPNLMISRSVNNRNADPMNLFGLKTTFKEPVAFIEKSIYTSEELKKDFEILKDAILEGYPGLNDYISADSLISLYNNLVTELNTPKTKQEYTQIIQKLINPLRDDHFAIINKNESCDIQPKTEIYFGVQSDSLIAIRCLNEYKDYLGKKILSIDGVPSEELIRKIKPIIPNMADGYNSSRMDFEMLTVFWSYYKSYYKKEKGDSLVFKYSDGTEFRTTYKMHQIKDYTRFVRLQNGEQFFTTSIFQDSIAYLDINTFSLFEQTESDIKQFLDSLNQTNIDYLIIDVRDNPGGYEKSMAKLFSYFAKHPFKTTIAEKVTSNKPFTFAQNTQNLVPYESMFPRFTIEKDDGYYLPDSLLSEYKPDNQVSYQGNVFVLTNAFSFSAASIFAALFKKYGRGVIIGQETGGAYCHVNALKNANILLPNTHTEIKMPLVQVVFDEKANAINPWGRGVLPNLEIPLTFEVFTEKEDIILTKALQLIDDYDYTLKNKSVEPNADNRLTIIFGFIGLILIGLIIYKLRHTTKL